MTPNFRATFIGFVFTVFSLLVYYTYVVPFFIMLPVSLSLELIFKMVYPGALYAKIGYAMIISLAFSFLLLSLLFFRLFIRQAKRGDTYTNAQVTVYMFLLMFVVHPLVFYSYLSRDWGRAGDGQFILSITETFQFSSLSFVIVGLVIDTLGSLIHRRRN